MFIDTGYVIALINQTDQIRKKFDPPEAEHKG
jgi:hypothetical protein